MNERQHTGLADPLITDHCPQCCTRRVPFLHLARGHVDPFCSTKCCKAWFRVQDATEALPDFNDHHGYNTAHGRMLGRPGRRQRVAG